MTARQRQQASWYAQTLYELMASMAAQTDYPVPHLRWLAGDPVAAARLTREVLGLAPDQPIGPLLRTLERGGCGCSPSRCRCRGGTPAPSGREETG